MSETSKLCIEVYTSCLSPPQVPDVTSATRTDTLILDTPQSVQIVPEEVLEDQQVIRLDEALRNVSGVTFGGTDLGRNLQFNIRGFDEAPILRDGFRQFGADIVPETANLEQVEVLKGPASVLYGEIEPGGLINLVTKKPTAEPFYKIETQFGNRSFISPSIDFSGPLTENGNVLYRLNALYRSSDDIQDVDENIERFFISPVVTWKIGKNTDLNFELEYLNEDRPPSFGVPAIDNEIADVPLDRITNEPDDFGEEEFLSVGYDLEHRFSKNWKLRNAFRFTQQNALLETAFPFEIDEETGTVTRFWAEQPQDGNSYSLQTNAEGKFATGKVDHEVLFGLDLNLAKDNFNDLIRLDEETPLELDLFNPIYGTSPRPDFNTLPLISDRETETRRLGLFAQDRVAFGDKFFLLAGLRYDTVEQIVTDNLEQAEVSNTDDAVIPRVGVVYKPTKPISLYASYSQSFTPNPETTSDGEALDPEKGEGFEFGVKSEFLKGKLFTTLAYFNINKENVASEDPDDPFSFVTTGEQKSQGVELDVTGEIMSGWNIIASYAYIVWIGQLASMLGSEMTNFAITIWAWQVTGQATPLSFILFFTQTPKVVAALFAGVLVDRLNRQKLMMVGDLLAGCSMIAILLLFLGDRLEIWHLYFTGAVNGLFGFLQGLAYSASLSSIVPQQHYTRATALNSVRMSGAYILAPALAGSLYPIIGLTGILIIDIVTFIIAISTLSIVHLPQINRAQIIQRFNLKQDLTLGFRYLLQHPRLLAILVFLLLENLIENINFAILPAMILARSGNDATAWGRLLTSFGIGGVIGAATISIWGGFKRRIHGILLGSAVWKLGLIVLSITQTMSVKIGAALTCGFCSPFPDSSNQAIWMSKVKPDMQGRVFAARDLITQIAIPLGAAISGPLADRFFEPAMKTDSILAQWLGGIFGREPGAGMAVEIALFSSCGLILALVGYAVLLLRNVEEIATDHNSKTRTNDDIKDKNRTI